MIVNIDRIADNSGAPSNFLLCNSNLGLMARQAAYRMVSRRHRDIWSQGTIFLRDLINAR